LRVVIFFAAFAVLWAVLGGITKRVYDQFLPGVPDYGRWPIASLPWQLAAYAPGRPWNDLECAAVWGPAVATLLVPILAVTILARTRIERFLAWVLSGVLAVWALLATFQVQYGYITFSYLSGGWSGTNISTLWFILKPMLCELGICVLGVAMGIVIRKPIDAGKTAEATPE
jgi:hypothetical protein